MRTLFKLTILAVALAALSATAAARQGRGEVLAPSDAPPATAPSETPSTQASPTPETAPAQLNPDPLHPAGRLIEVSIARQRLTAWRDGKIVYRLVISTGRPGYETPPGHYKILEKYENRWSRKWSVWMPFAMRWYQGYFIHQLPHKDGSGYNIGASRLGKPDSHGCVRVNVGDAERLFRWTKVGTPVWVH